MLRSVLLVLLRMRKVMLDPNDLEAGIIRKVSLL